MAKTSICLMEKLEQLARELGHMITYENNLQCRIETLSYRDSTSQIIAVQYPGEHKFLDYHIDVKRLESYLSGLKTLNSDISGRILQNLEPRTQQASVPTDGSQRQIGDRFDLTNFSGIADLIRLHARIA